MSRVKCANVPGQSTPIHECDSALELVLRELWPLPGHCPAWPARVPTHCLRASPCHVTRAAFSLVLVSLLEIGRSLGRPLSKLWMGTTLSFLHQRPEMAGVMLFKGEAGHLLAAGTAGASNASHPASHLPDVGPPCPRPLTASLPF